jgi:hypothetical protein
MSGNITKENTGVEKQNDFKLVYIQPEDSEKEKE